MVAAVSGRIESLRERLRAKPQRWLITGVAGFIGCNLLEALLMLDQHVVGLDNFSTGFAANLDAVRAAVGPERAARFSFIEGDICALETCQRAVAGVDHVLHQAALGSVPRSLDNPIATNAANVTGFLNMLVAARDAKVSSFTYAASSSTYGDHPALPKVEDVIGKPLSPYAVTKYVNELYAEVFARSYGFKTIGLRYFNVYGPRQNPNGAYAAVIPKWIDALMSGADVFINGDGTTSRDFCFISNVIEANLLAAFADEGARNQVYNVALGDSTSLTALFEALRDGVRALGITYDKAPIYRDFRAGDVKHSKADVSKIVHLLGYQPRVRLQEGVGLTVSAYVAGRVAKV